MSMPRLIVNNFCLLKIKNDSLLVKPAVRFILNDSKLGLNHFIAKRKNREKLGNSSTEIS